MRSTRALLHPGRADSPRAGNAGVVKTLLARPVDLEAADEYGSTALIMAALRGDEEIVKWLLDAGADSAAADRNGWTAMVWATSRRHQGVVELLKQYNKV